MSLKIKWRKIGQILLGLLITYMSLVFIVTTIMYIKLIVNPQYFPSLAKDPHIYNIIWWGFNASPTWLTHWYNNPVSSNADKFSFATYSLLLFAIAELFVIIIGLYIIINSKGYYYYWILTPVFFFFIPYGYLFGSVMLVSSIILYIHPANIKESFEKRIEFNKKVRHNPFVNPKE